MSAWLSLPQQWLMTTWNKQTSTILTQKSAAVLWHCYRSTLKRFLCKLLQFLLRRRFVSRIGIMLNITPLRSLDIFYNRASRSQKGKILSGTSMQATKRTLWVFTACKQLKPRDKMCIHLGCSMTHGRAKLIPHWIPHFHQIFTPLASSKTKMDKNVFLRFGPDMKKS